jgi:glycosyltransferase involved in cell wall biosynthesis
MTDLPVNTDSPTHDALRVLLVTKGLDLGGIERVVVDLATGLATRGVGVEVAVVTSRRDRLAPAIESAGITLHRLDGSDRIGFRAARRLARLVRDPSYDVVHVHGPLPSVVARLAARTGSAGGRVVTTSHTPWTSLRPSTRLAWRATSGLDAATIAVSAAVAASLPARAGRRAVVIPHGIDPDVIEAALAAARRSDPQAPDTAPAIGVFPERPGGAQSPGGAQTPDHARDVGVFPARPGGAESPGGAQTPAPEEGTPGVVTVVAVASHRDAKNYPNLLRAVRMALDAGAPIRLVTIGEGPNLDAHIAFARSLRLDDAVTFQPTTVDVLTEIARADILAVASDYEGQPIVVAEALALGLPVVATAVGRVPEMVDTSVGRVVPPRDPVALAAALTELASSPELRAAMSAAARRQLRAWTLGDVIDAHLALYADPEPLRQ